MLVTDDERTGDVRYSGEPSSTQRAISSVG